MTTPERIRRRQIIEIVCILALIFCTFWIGYQNDKSDNESRACLRTVIEDLTETLTLSRTLTREDILNLSEANDVQDRLIRKALSAKTQAELRKATREYEIDSANLKNQIIATQAVREKNPIPPFPTGECQ